MMSTVNRIGRALRRIVLQAVRGFLKWDLASVGTVVVVIAAVLASSVPAFFSEYNLAALGFTLAVTGLVALAQLSVLAVGQFNLALTAIGVIVGMVTAWLMQATGMAYGLAVVIGIAVGSLAGALQGVVIAYTGINPFLISLATASIYLGGTMGITRGESFNRLPAEFVAIGRLQAGPIPVLLLACILLCIGTYVLLERTVVGRQLLATGASSRVSRMSGIDTNRIVVVAHTLSGALAAVAGVMLVARLGSAQPSLGSGWLLPSFAAPVLGGTLLSGGKASIPGALLGAVLLAVIANGLQLFNVSPFFYQAFLGVILVLALAMDRARLSYVLRQKA